LKSAINTEFCFHCTDTLPTNEKYESIINNTLCHFCCPACLAIAETIHNGGLDNYYKQRDSKAQKIQRHTFSMWDDIESQKSFITQDADISTAKLYIEGIHCTSCAWLIEKQLSHQQGVTQADLNYQQQCLVLSFNRNDNNISQLMESIADIGYMPHPYHADAIKELQQFETKNQLKQIGITAILMMQIGMFSIAIYAGDFLGIDAEHKQLLSIFSLLFSIPLLYFSAMPFFNTALLKLKNKQLTIDVSISLAIIGLYISSVYSVLQKTGDFYFDSIAMFCLFILISRFIEKQSRASLLLPTTLLPQFATVMKNNEAITIPTNDLQLGDHVLIRQGETLPIDGKVIEGQSSVSEAFLNGEPKPLLKTINDIVYAGSTNHDGELIISVINESNNTFVKNIEKLTQNAAIHKPQAQTFTDSIASKFTLVVYVLAIGTFFYWQLQGNNHAFWIALSVLVISCPCALSLAAPTALSTVHTTLRKAGIIIQSSLVIEKINSITHVIFDKTGTLTEGHYSITKTVLVGDDIEEQCLSIAHALEANSKHPISMAFTVLGLHAKNITLHTNQGIEGSIDKQRYRIGNPLFCQIWHNHVSPPDNNGQWIGLCSKQQMLAWFLLHDATRSDASTLTQFLQNKGIHCEILSGDNSITVDEIAHKLNITSYAKSCTSADKLHHLKMRQESGAVCLMVGDGVNDAPVLSQSDISVTLLDACDWVKNSTDIILLNNRLNDIALTIQYAARYKSIVKQNFLWAFLYNSISIPFAMAGFVTPYWAAIGMSLSSIAVVLNSRRLRK
jgi:Cu2+-exporting ATPase